MLCPEGLAASISAAAIAIANGKTLDEIGLLSAVFTQLGDTLATIAATRGLCESKQEASKAEI